MKTAVEWLDEQLQDTMYFVYGYTDGVRKVTIPLEDYMRLKQEALEMEKEQKVENKDSFGEISDKSWEGCDGCTEQDEVMYKNGYVKGYNSAISELPKEISDYGIKRKIEKEIKKRYETTQNDAGFRDGWFLAIKWYREQLKKKQ